MTENTPTASMASRSTPGRLKKYLDLSKTPKVERSRSALRRASRMGVYTASALVVASTIDHSGSDKVGGNIVRMSLSRFKESLRPPTP
jgi:hypothetical protein